MQTRHTPVNLIYAEIIIETIWNISKNLTFESNFVLIDPNSTLPNFSNSNFVEETPQNFRQFLIEHIGIINTSRLYSIRSLIYATVQANNIDACNQIIRNNNDLFEIIVCRVQEPKIPIKSWLQLIKTLYRQMSPKNNYISLLIPQELNQLINVNIQLYDLETCKLSNNCIPDPMNSILWNFIDFDYNKVVGHFTTRYNSLFVFHLQSYIEVFYKNGIIICPKYMLPLINKITKINFYSKIK
tara:strand:- start:427 stop:1152 length:726 start_codon:yes stop_codon:yes gene_type:complete